jgi:aryl-alcohol dehydrogenase-like predicted oxidoreductase
MKYRKLGRTGFDGSDIAHGLWGMSGWIGSEDQESLRAMQSAIDLGCSAIYWRAIKANGFMPRRKFRR